MTQAEHDELELANLERKLEAAENPRFPVAGQEEERARYRDALRRDVRELRDRVDAREAYDLDDPKHPDYVDLHGDAA